MRGRLRARLTLLGFSMAFLVLAGLTWALCLVSEREYAAQQRARAVEEAGRITGRLLGGAVVDTGWLAGLERQGRLVVAIEDGGVPLYFRGAWQPATDRAWLVSKAKAEAARLGLELGPAGDGEAPVRQMVFDLQGTLGDSYRGVVAAVAAPAGRYTLVLLWDRARELNYLRGRRLVYLGLGAAGAAVLLPLCWLLAGVAARPVARSLQRQRAFVAAASHELRAPLASISASAAAILVDGAGTPGYVRAIEGECARLGRLVGDLLTLASADAGTWTVERLPVHLDTLLIELCEQLAPLARERGHALTLCLPDAEELPPVWGSEARMRQVVRNLAENAMAHAGGEGPIEITARRLGGQVRLAVADHGAGIPREDRQRVFERFCQLDGARSDKAHFGLGLSIAAELTRLQGGRLTLLETPGGGCTFVVTLPAAHTAGEVIPAPQNPPPKRD